MKLVIAIAALVASTSFASAQYYGSRSNSYGNSGLYGTGSNPSSHYVSPSYNLNSGYRSGHYQTNPNNTQMDNYGTRGNYNPYTGQYGTRRPRY